MRIAVFDQDERMREFVEALVVSAGHDLAGVADTPAAAVGLLQTAHLDAVIIDTLLGFNSDFDLVQVAIDAGVRPIVFSREAHADRLRQYDVRPVAVLKPDLTALEAALQHLAQTEDSHGAQPEDRRQRPTRAAAGPAPSSLSDAQAFFEALNEAQPGDGMASIATSGDEHTAQMLADIVRGTDRLMAFPTAVRVLLPGSEEEGVRSFLGRVSAAGAAPSGSPAEWIVVLAGEHGADAFDRLKFHGTDHRL